MGAADVEQMERELVVQSYRAVDDPPEGVHCGQYCLADGGNPLGCNGFRDGCTVGPRP